MASRAEQVKKIQADVAHRRQEEAKAKREGREYVAQTTQKVSLMKKKGRCKCC